jgi:uncharacterized protein (TIGR02145 family)
MKVFIAPIWVLLSLFLYHNSSAQDIIYTISGEIDSHKTPLDSIAVENLSKITQIGFGNLPERDDYRINLTRDEYWGSTSVNDMLNERGLQIIKNMPGTIVVGYRSHNSVNANISLHNNNGQRLAFKENQLLENGSLIEVEIGNSGIYFLTISSPEETRSFKATGLYAEGNIAIATQSGTPLHLKSGQVYTLAGTGTEKGDNVKVSVFKTGYMAHPVELTVDGNETLVFPLEALSPPTVQTLEATNILSNSATLNGNVLSEGSSPLTERGFYWSTSNENPDEADNIIIVDGTTGSFSAELNEIQSNTRYYFRSFAINNIGISLGEPFEFITEVGLAQLSTMEITDTTAFTAISGGDISYDGGAEITARGVCWNTTGRPTIYENKTSDGAGSGRWTSEITNLSSKTTYYVRAYATNAKGTAYGQEVVFTTKLGVVHGNFTDTRDGTRYKTVTIGTQTWMAENLAYLPEVSPTREGSRSEPYFYVLGYAGNEIETAKESENYIKYGASYNWAAAMEACPSGWHLPSDNEWMELELAIGMSLSEAEKNGWRGTDEGMKLKNNTGWLDGWNGTNEFGFAMLPGGFRFRDGQLEMPNNRGRWWSSTEYDTEKSWRRGVDFNNTRIGRYVYHKEFGFNVRCIKDSETTTGLPIVITRDISQVEHNGSLCGGDIISDGGSAIVERGLCWNTTGNPSISDTISVDGTGMGGWNTPMTGLQPNTTYFVRAFARNSTGIGYGNLEVFTTLNEDNREWPFDTTTTVVEVTNPATGRIWMDRNLGAERVATSITDEQSLGYLYQWGRATDGHQQRNSAVSTTMSNTDIPGHGDFISSGSSHLDWRSEQNNNLWQNFSGGNNPCPTSYRIPTEAEWEAERQSWTSSNANGAFGSNLKLTLAGQRNGLNATIENVETSGNYWSSTVNGNNANNLYINSNNATIENNGRAFGHTVRCIKDDGYILSFILNPANAGTVSGGGLFTQGTQTVVNTYPTDGYQFVNWTIDDEVISNVAEFTFTMPSNDVVLTANFTEYGDWPRDTTTVIVEITNPATGRIWMDRNLGALRAATGSTDEEAYGDLYQWGRAADGHQARNSSTTSVLSSNNNPGHAHFILVPDFSWDWRSPRNDNLWQGVFGINNPCPVSFYVPTEAEWDAEMNTWSSNNATGAFNSPLKLTRAGIRENNLGALNLVGSDGFYWSSTVSNFYSRRIAFNNAAVGKGSTYRAAGYTVRCIKYDGTIPDSYSLILESNPPEAGTLRGAGTHIDGNTVHISATANEGYRFISWEIDGEIISTSSSFAYTMPPNSVTITANFEEQEEPDCPSVIFTTVLDVTNPATGKTWMDRNLGAVRAATGSTDIQAYGDLYQWGRADDAHQVRTSPTTSTLATNDTQDHCHFILSTESPFDWRSPQNTELWQGLNGINNPCPSAYRLPTIAEWEAELQSWGSNKNATGAITSPLKLPLGGSRYNSDGSLNSVGTEGFYWSSTIDDARSRGIYISSSIANASNYSRAFGFSVRCIKDENSQATLPSVTTSEILIIDPHTANIGGIITSNGGAVITARGVCWNTTGNPGINGNHTSDSTGTGSWLSELVDLQPGANYYVRAYATNSQGTAYGEELSFTTDCPVTTDWLKDSVTAVIDITNPATGKTWMDRNLGASRPAENGTDEYAYGDLYQWGRAADGHQARNSSITSVLSICDDPWHSNFILSNSSAFYDWRNPQNNNLWQGENGLNNPCPDAYRLPTIAEWEAEQQSWGIDQNSVGAFASPLKLTMAGYRNSENGELINTGSIGFYWSSTINDNDTHSMNFNSEFSSVYFATRASGLSVRCIKDEDSQATLPSVSTSEISNISDDTAYGGGNVTSNGGAIITARGVCWNTTGNPNTNDNYTSDEAGMGEWTSEITGLQQGTTYFVRAYATNSEGTAYGEEFSFTTECPVTTDWPRDTETVVVDVTNPATGKTWMDRNLGASRTATNSTDELAYGDLYQWGRAADGHQKRNSPSTSTLSGCDTPGHGTFIISNSDNDYNWLNSQNNELWQGVNGLNNPCPNGYRLPTNAEWQAERDSWESNNAEGAFASPLKLPLAGSRLSYNGLLFSVGYDGYVWSSTVGDNASWDLNFRSNTARNSRSDRAYGQSVRCIKD